MYVYLTTGPCSSISLWRSALMVEAAEGEEGPMEEDADGTEAETTEAAAASRSASEETEAEAMVRWTRWYRWSRRCRSCLNVKRANRNKIKQYAFSKMRERCLVL